MWAERGQDGLECRHRKNSRQPNPVEETIMPGAEGADLQLTVACEQSSHLPDCSSTSSA